MTWIMAILLALIAFGIAVLLFRIEKALWTSLGAALTFGLVGYAVQASPDLPSAPKAMGAANTENTFDIVAARREFIADDERSRADALLTADAYAQRGRYIDAATILAGITSANSEDFEAWIAQGNALAEHADGTLTAPALYAYRQASIVKPDHLAPNYFLGVALVRQGRLMEARQIWREALDSAPEGAVGRAGLEERLSRLDTMLGAMGAMNAAPPQDSAE
ncbi:tetratricopeptide repeat protein [Aurantiacibacter sp. D1-12]|uniref:tetratricopeptide repeat protein n=1 Tax=Aurantiacibacter sp. D1-12 TaxID=2993658 RepID=UPI00237C686F|nr:cytochrome C biosynthesis protein [Aurantiacibacter sp. D1-12]MDE1466460.1 cytochrome C biosynthesis protein [Aurantiacibacter sp. D1-12]